MRIQKFLYKLFHRHQFIITEEYDSSAIIQLPLWGTRLKSITVRCSCGLYHKKVFKQDIRFIDWVGSRQALAAGHVDDSVLMKLAKMADAGVDKLKRYRKQPVDNGNQVWL